MRKKCILLVVCSAISRRFEFYLPATHLCPITAASLLFNWGMTCFVLQNSELTNTIWCFSQAPPFILMAGFRQHCYGWYCILWEFSSVISCNVLLIFMPPSLGPTKFTRCYLVKKMLFWNSVQSCLKELIKGSIISLRLVVGSRSAGEGLELIDPLTRELNQPPYLGIPGSLSHNFCSVSEEARSRDICTSEKVMVPEQLWRQKPSWCVSDASPGVMWEWYSPHLGPGLLDRGLRASLLVSTEGKGREG